MSDTAILSEVRTAYRYVVAYERRVLDALSAFDEEVRDIGYTFLRWSPLHTTFPSRVRFAPNGWAWDNVPFCAARYRWALAGTDENEAGSSWLFVEHVADTAFEEHSAPKRTEPDPLEHLVAAAESDSVLHAWWMSIERPFAKRLWTMSWEKLIAAHFGRTLRDMCPRKPLKRLTHEEKGGAIFGSYGVSLGELSGPEDFSEKFVKPVAGALRSLRGSELS